MNGQPGKTPASLARRLRLGGWLLLAAWACLGGPSAWAQAGGAAGADHAVAAKLVGAWKLLSLSAKDSSGRVVHPLGVEVRGRLGYEANGRLLVQIMSQDRPQFATADPRLASEPAGRAAFDGYIAYYGTYSVEPDKGVVVHHIEAALIPNWVGTDQVRHFELEGDRLTIKGPLLLGGVQEEMSLVWERLP